MQIRLFKYTEYNLFQTKDLQQSGAGGWTCQHQSHQSGAVRESNPCAQENMIDYNSDKTVIGNDCWIRKI